MARDRVVELRRVRAGDLRPDPRNWRRHPPGQRAALSRMLDRLGYVDAVIARPGAALRFRRASVPRSPQEDVRARSGADGTEAGRCRADPSERAGVPMRGPLAAGPPPAHVWRRDRSRMVTDPPYGVAYDASWRKKAFGSSGGRLGKVRNDDDPAYWAAALEACKPPVAYIWSPSGENVLVFGRILKAAGYGLRNQIIWRKPKLVISRGHYHWQHECLWYGVLKRKDSGMARGQESNDGVGHHLGPQCRGRALDTKARGVHGAPLTQPRKAMSTTRSWAPAPASLPPSARTAPVTPWR